ncbi:MAG: hypothetical protein Q9187_004821, partial [Circinaria calcarea]
MGLTQPTETPGVFKLVSAPRIPPPPLDYKQLEVERKEQREKERRERNERAQRKKREKMEKKER